MQPFIRLSPFNSLHFECEEHSSISEHSNKIKSCFHEDWRKGWFYLAANKTSSIIDPSCYFWQQIASQFLTSLCHLPAETKQPIVKTPSVELLDEWISKAPPMQGGEYLSANALIILWKKLNDWVVEIVSRHENIQDFLSENAPTWKQVGRVCFHLAENKTDSNRPFAFLATYSTGFGLGGQLKHLPLGEALKQYSGSNNRETLIKLLTPVQHASEKCPWVKELIISAELYQPLAWTTRAAYKFLNSIPLLEESGLTVRIPNWWKQRQRPKIKISIGSKASHLLGANTLLDFNISTALGGEPLTAEELSQLLESKEKLTYFKGQWVEVDRDKLEEVLDHWKKIQKLSKNGQVSFAEGMRLLAGAPIHFQEKSLRGDLLPWSQIIAEDALADVLKKIRDPSLVSHQALSGLSATLRPYQVEGLKWLSLLTSLGLGACLADDMGLGKTLQLLALLLRIKNENSLEIKSPSLLVVPASLLSNWKQEAQRFTPSLSLFLLHPSEGKNNLLNVTSPPADVFANIDLVVTTYSMITKYEWLSKMRWNLIVLDEAQVIKNAETKQSTAIKKLSSQSRIALTGTPIENRLSDLWALFDFLNPSLLGTAKKFKEYTDSLKDQPEQFEILRKLVSPYILRRMKTDPKIITDLPEKIETPVYCYLSKQQVVCYQSIIDEMARLLETADPKTRKGLILKSLMQLKQICNHPSQYLGTYEYTPEHSGKFERLKQICEELAERQEKVILFTQFSEIIPTLEEFLSQIFRRRGVVLHGGTPIKKRKELVQAFQTDPDLPFFILSLKAGGTGLNLTAANHVIHFDRWWNPAVENQATDRAFRIGQKKNVQVHKFITLGTVEEKIDEIILVKNQLTKDLFAVTEEISLTELSNRELFNFLNLDRGLD